MKREPTLADEFLQQKDSEQLVTKQQNSSAKNNLLESKRFILDEESAVYIAEMIKNFPRIIADAQDFAIPPFTKTWIEFPFSKFWESVNSYPPLEDVDKRVGF